MRKVLFVKYNALRRPEYQITTTIYEQDGERFVEKVAASQEAQQHIDDFQENCQLLMCAHKEVCAAVPIISDHVAVYEYISGKTMEEELQEEFSDVEKLICKIQENLRCIYAYKDSYVTEFVCTNVFKNIFGLDNMTEEQQMALELLKGNTAVTAADVDLVFDNIIKKDGKWMLLDYEWVLTIPVPIDFLRYRTAAYFYDRHNLYFQEKYTREDYLEKLEIDRTLVPLFDAMEKGFQHHVRGDYQYLKRYEKEIIPFRDYEKHVVEMEQRDASINFLNDVIASQNEYIVSMEQLIQKWHSNPAYKLMNGVRKLFRKTE